MSESILQEWEAQSKKELSGYTYGLPDKISLYHNLNRILLLLARDKIMREALKFYSDQTFQNPHSIYVAVKKGIEKEYTNSHGGRGEKAREALAEADQILETTNKGENE